MDSFRITHLKSRVSLIVCLYSAITREEVYIQDITVWLEGVAAKPAVKSDGCFIFDNVPEGFYTLHIASTYYFAEKREIQVNSTSSSTSMIQIGLLPLPSYPFSMGLSILRISVRTQRNQPVADAFIELTVIQEDGARGRITQEIQESGSTVLTLGAVTGTVWPTDRYLLRSRSANKIEEQIQIEKVSELGRRAELGHPLQHAYPRGSYLLPVVKTITDANGEAVAAFSNLGVKQFRTQLFVENSTKLDQQDERILKEVVLEEGKTVSLTIIL
ncbi:beta-sandwich domain-containing protein [Paenibacillus turpanensis]|uniref:beta-sandwich domain-containing protein n=1 Tax=Paenibacillus turpanensis TaxID=2689078 RepID=UPI0014079501|nr:DUF2012 domain-containing protein [Paenibacillus turpanensis]